MENEKAKTPLWIKLLLLILLLQNMALFYFADQMMTKLEQRFDTLEERVAQTQNVVGESITTVSQEVENVLIQQSSLVSDFYYTLQPAPRGKVQLTLSAQLKNYMAGSAASFSITVDNGETSLIKTTLANNTLTAETTLPVCDLISVGLVITDKQNTQAQALDDIRNVSACLTDHLLLTPDLQIKQKGADLFLSGSLSLLNEYGSLEEQQLDMARLEVKQGDTLLHSFYFSQDFSGPAVEGQDHHILLFERIKTPAKQGEPIRFSVRARDKGGFEYLCTFGEALVDENGLASPWAPVEEDFTLTE